MQKIFELSGEKWMQGLSAQVSLPYGGIFRRATNFNPFELIGTMSPGSSGARLGSGTITKAIRAMVSVYLSSDGASRILAYGDDSALYKIAPSSGTVTDISSSITSGSTTARGAILWKNYFIYLKNTEARSWDLSTTNAPILSSLTNGVPHDPVIGADGYLYIPNGNSVARCTDPTTTASTNILAAFSLETGMVIRQLLNDGQYLVILADNNSNNTNGNFRCVLAYWDMVSGSAERIYDWYENRAYCMEMKADSIYIHCSDYMYVSNVATSPKPLFPFQGSNTSPALIPSNIDYFRGSLVWAKQDGTDNCGRIDAYGNVLGGKSIFYTPIVNTTETTANTPTAILPYTYDTTNSYYFMALDDALSGGANPRLYKFNYTGREAGATRATATIRVADIILPRPYKFEYAKIVLRQPIGTDVTASDETVSFLMKAQGSNVTVSSSQTLSTTGKTTKIFYPRPTTGTPEYIEEINDITITAYKAVVEKLEIWGTPITQQIDKI